jgi:hypothetical protein
VTKPKPGTLPDVGPESNSTVPETHDAEVQQKLDDLFGEREKSARAPTRKGAVLGNFGVEDREEEPHFLVEVPTARSGTVRLWEVRQTVDDRLVRLPRAELNRTQWEEISPTMEKEFNRQLAEDGMQPGKFRRTGETRLSLSNLGKEMMVLVWAIESIPETDLSVVRASWLQLHRIERWWLFNMTVAVNGDLNNRGHGWRLALMYALSARPADPARETRANLTSIQLKELPREKKQLRSRKGLDPLFRKTGRAS